jgi:hypothetical protein
MDNIKMNLKDRMDWIYLAQDKEGALLNTIMNFLNGTEAAIITKHKKTFPTKTTALDDVGASMSSH